MYRASLCCLWHMLLCVECCSSCFRWFPTWSCQEVRPGVRVCAGYSLFVLFEEGLCVCIVCVACGVGSAFLTS